MLFLCMCNFFEILTRIASMFTLPGQLSKVGFQNKKRRDVQYSEHPVIFFFPLIWKDVNRTVNPAVCKLSLIRVIKVEKLFSCPHAGDLTPDKSIYLHQQCQVGKLSLPNIKKVNLSHY